MPTSNDTFLVVWNRDQYAVELKESFGADNVVTSLEELTKAFERESNHKGILVLAELTWEDSSFSELAGINLVRTIIRPRLKLRLPICFLSFLPLREIVLDSEKRQILERKIVGAVGHDFVRLPITPNEAIAKLRKIEPLSELQIVDVVNNLCDVRGLIGEVIHSIQGKFRDLMASKVSLSDPEVRGRLQQGLEEIANLLGNSEEIEATQKEILERFDREVIRGRTDVHTFLVARGEELKALVLDEREIQLSTPLTPTPWTVLILDDEPLGLTALRQTLEERGIRCVISNTVAEAEKHIESDVFNEIVVAISDYRLYENINGLQRQQRRQGYDFLFDLAPKDRLTRLIALSGLSRKFLLETFKRYNTRVEVFSKNYLRTEGALNLFGDAVLDIGNEAYKSLCSQPTASGWAVLRPFYIAHRASQDYSEAEGLIGERARGYLLRIEEIYQGRDEGLLLNPSLEELEDLQSDLRTKDVNNDPAVLKRFRNKLVARRIALWLYFVKDFEPVRIYAALTGRLDVNKLLEEIKDDLRAQGEAFGPNWAAEIDENAQTRLEDRAKPLLSKLALTLSEFPLGLLVEEKRWFRYDMGISNLYDRLELMDQAFYFVQLGLESWTRLCPESVPKLRQAKVWPKKGNPRLTSWGEAKSVLENMKEALAAKYVTQFQRLLNNIQANITANVELTDEIRGFLEHLNAQSARKPKSQHAPN